MSNSLYIYGLIKQAAPSGLGDDGYGLDDEDDPRKAIPQIHNTDPNSVFNFWLDNRGRGLDLSPTPQHPSQGEGAKSGPPSNITGHDAPHRLSPRLEEIFGQDSYTRHGTGQAPHNGAMKTYIPSKGTYERVENHGTDDKGRKNLFSGTTPAAMRRRFARHSLTPIEPQYNDKGRYMGTPTAVGEKGGPTFFKHRGPNPNLSATADVVDPYWEEHKKNYIGLTHQPTFSQGPAPSATGLIRPRYYSGPTPAGSLARRDTPTISNNRPPTTAALRGMYAGLGLDNRPDWNTFKKDHKSYMPQAAPTPTPTPTPAPTPAPTPTPTPAPILPPGAPPYGPPTPRL